jgi:RNA 2',3'-cyclic 3'-phosphodiesterase
MTAHVSSPPTPTPAALARPARLFLALMPDEGSGRALAAWQRQRRWPEDARVYRREDLHLTLHFLGAVPRARVGDLVPALALTGADFRFELSGLAHWASAGVAVLTPAQVPEALQALRNTLADKLALADLTPDPRPFAPHVTVARTRLPLLDLRLDAPLPWRSEGHVLMESDRGYRVIHHYSQQPSPH